MTDLVPKRGMRITAGIMLGFGFLTVIAALPALQFPVAFLLDGIIWSFGNAPDLNTTTHRLIFAITGGITIGWGALIWMMAVVPGPEVRRAVIVGCCVWFGVDSLFSVAAGVPLNVLGNALFLFALLVPMATRRIGQVEAAR